MTYHRVCNKSNTTYVTCGAGPAYHPVVYEFTPVYCNVCVARPFVFCVMFCRSLFVLLSIFFWQLYCLSFKLRFQTFIVDNHQKQLRRERFKRQSGFLLIRIIVTPLKAGIRSGKPRNQNFCPE
jgi:hypothetical protein